ncbi:hypothetical protein OG455_08990 [Kitasatospora sp. NBC_01287]|uniref:hypothetical protein n=1 Tax=Kitasatospora sp. NBC_01287 TaxID=2903573 RepID=UPI002254A145|nr:hypothetical protein [Kitasatospora sp. NBC_01287]MCX4745655.1 hypothetical protein [Kitasatospora sp. NBC_01287]
MRHRFALALVAVLSAAALASCSGGPPPQVPMPSEVPTAPRYAAASDIVDTLAKAGIPCTVTISIVPLGGGSDITCTATVDGPSFDLEIKDFDSGRYSRDDIGNSIASRRTDHQTIVAAANWYINVVNPTYAPQIAKALGGVVLPGDELKIPDYPLPSIPPTPRYDTVQQLAAALDGVVGCQDQKPGGNGSLTCETGSRVGHTPNCANLQLYAGDAERDKALRTAIAYRGVPAYLATAANWSVNLCDYGLADQVAKALQGVVVSYDGQ